MNGKGDRQYDHIMMMFRGWSLRFGVFGLEFRVYGLGSCKAACFQNNCVGGLGFRVWGLGNDVRQCAHRLVVWGSLSS